MIEIKEVSKAYASTFALQGVDLNLPRGKTTVLIGPSGCGKSTLLRLMIGLSPVDSGAIFFDGEKVTTESALRLRQKMGYVIQDGGLFPHLTVRKNVSLMADYLGRPQNEIAARVEELATLTKLPMSALDRYPAQLSGGQRQRVGLMRALMLDPACLLLDEPMGALDVMIRRELQEDLRNIFKSLKKTVVLVTHDLGEANFFGDQVAFLKSGKLLQVGPFRSLLETPADPFITRFIQAQRDPVFVEPVSEKEHS